MIAGSRCNDVQGLRWAQGSPAAGLPSAGAVASPMSCLSAAEWVFSWVLAYGWLWGARGPRREHWGRAEVRWGTIPMQNMGEQHVLGFQSCVWGGWWLQGPGGTCREGGCLVQLVPGWGHLHSSVKWTLASWPQVGSGTPSPAQLPQPGRSRLFPAVSLASLPPHRRTSPPFQAAICLFCWTWDLLKCLSMDEGTQSRRTEPGRLHGEWKIVFWTFWSFKA